MKKINYNTAYQELQEILEKLQSDEVSIEDLSTHVKKAQELLQICNEKLRLVEKQVDQLIEDKES